MATLANLVVQISGNTAKLNQALMKSQGRLQQFSGKGVAAAKAIGPPFLVAAGAATAFGVASVKAFVQTGDELDKMSRRTGVSTEALSTLGFAAEQSGTDLGTLEKGIRTMQKRTLDWERGLSTATEAFDLLGLELETFQAQSPEEQFRSLAGAIAQVEDPTRQAALAQEVFGRAGTQLLPLIQEGAAGMADLEQQARELGIEMSGPAAKSAADFNDGMNRLNKGFQGILLAVGEVLVDALLPLIDVAEEVIGELQAWVQENKALINLLSGAFAQVLRFLAQTLLFNLKNILGAVRTAIDFVVEGINFFIRVMNKIPAALRPWEDLEEISLDNVEAMDAAATSADALGGEVGELGMEAGNTGTAIEGLGGATAAADAKMKDAASTLTGMPPLMEAWRASNAVVTKSLDEAGLSLQRLRAEAERTQRTIGKFASETRGQFQDLQNEWSGLQFNLGTGSRGLRLGGGGSAGRGGGSDSGGSGGGAVIGAIPTPGRSAFSYLTDEEYERLNPLAGFPTMANGGIVRSPTFALIGEAGPEAVVPLDRFGGGQTIIVNIGELRAEQDDVDFVVNAIRDAVASGDLDVDELG